MELKSAFTSTGEKLFYHQEAMQSLRSGRAKVVTAHAMLTDSCQHGCAFCSVHHREGNTLPFNDIIGFFDILLKYGLKSAILSGGGNPILYKCKETGKNFNDVVDALYQRDLQIGLITNGAPMQDFSWIPPGTLLSRAASVVKIRRSWKTVTPYTLDMLTWIRISMAGLDHDERSVAVPDIDLEKTTLGFSYVGHDVHFEPADPYHGKVSTQADLITLDRSKIQPTWWFEDRIPELTEQIAGYAARHRPTYIRLLPNCLEVPKIEERCVKLQAMADDINNRLESPGYRPAFVQYKPPKAPKACYLGYVHPVLNSDGFVLPCDSCCLNESADHKLGEAWRICHWKDIGEIYEKPVRSLIKDPSKMCPGCVFTTSNGILRTVVDGTADLTPPAETPIHANFI